MFLACERTVPWSNSPWSKSFAAFLDTDQAEARGIFWQAPRVLPRGRQGQEAHLANLSKWPDDPVRGFRILLKGGVAVKSVDDVFEILRSRRHGHVAAVMVRRQVARPFGHRAPRRPSSGTGR